MVMKVFNKIIDFLLCLIQGTKCQYSIKKVLSFLFTFLIFYIAIFTEKEYYELLFILATLLGMREYSKKIYNDNNDNNDNNNDNNLAG